MVEIMPITEVVIPISEMTRRINRNRQTLWMWWNTGKFPTPIMLNGRTIGWRESDYMEWLKNNQAQVPDEIKVSKAF